MEMPAWELFAADAPETRWGLNTLSVLKWLVACVLSIWAGLSTTVHLLVVLMALDFFTGLTGAIVTQRLSAAVSFRGLAKKTMTLVLIYVGHSITKPLNVGFDLGEMIALAYVLNEVISITENCVEVGVPIPPILSQTLAKFRKVMPTGDGESVTTIQQTEVVVIPPAKKHPKHHPKDGAD
jgi:toxin secretion/phage lysis holin